MQIPKRQKQENSIPPSNTKTFVWVHIDVAGDEQSWTHKIL